MAEFTWTKKRRDAVIMLADGYKVKQVSDAVGISERQLYRLLNDLDFAQELDRLTLISTLATRAERLRFAKHTVRETLEKRKAKGQPVTDKDLLDWMKYIQSETDGIKIGFADLLEQFAPILNNDAPVSRSGYSGDTEAQEGEAQGENNPN